MVTVVTMIQLLVVVMVVILTVGILVTVLKCSLNVITHFLTR
jgi:hypothetical protein